MDELRAAGPDDVAELVRLRAVMLADLGRDPGPAVGGWRPVAAQWFRERLDRPQEWAFRVVAADGGHLRACGAAWLTEHLPGPRAPRGYRGYIGFMCTEPAARGQGCARRILRDLLGWLERQDVTRIELHASPAGHSLYRSEGFADDAAVPMYRDVSRAGSATAGTPTRR